MFSNKRKETEINKKIKDLEEKENNFNRKYEVYKDLEKEIPILENKKMNHIINSINLIKQSYFFL